MKIPSCLAPCAPQGSRLENTAPTRSWRLSRALCLWSDSFTTWESSRRTPASPRRRKEKLYADNKSSLLVQTYRSAALNEVLYNQKVKNFLLGCFVFDSVCVFCVQLEAFDVSICPELQQQLSTVVQELGVNVPPPVSHLIIHPMT